MKKSNNQSQRQRKLQAKKTKRDKQDKHLLENAPRKSSKSLWRLGNYEQQIRRLDRKFQKPMFTDSETKHSSKLTDILLKTI